MRLIYIALATTLLSTTGCANEAAVSPVPTRPEQIIKLPAGFELNVFADLRKYHKLGANAQPRMMTFDGAGNLYVSITRQNQVIMFEKNKQQAESAGQLVVVAEGLNAPHGLAFVGEKLYVANQDSIVMLEKNDEKWPSKPPVTIVKDLPTGGHTVKSLKLGPDGLLYTQVGSSCNVCNESDPLRATMLRYTPEGKSAGALTTLGRHAPNPIYAYGLRNSQGFAWHPVSKKMFATNEGADNRSETKNGAVNDELPPEHLNQIEAGRHYGWPHCWSDPSKPGKMFSDPNFVREASFCETTTAPVTTFTSHSTPIGIAFLHGARVPQNYQEDAIVALHGSWNRKNPSGYKLVRVKFEGDKPVKIEDFAIGWLTGNEAWGRPVDVVVGPDGAIYVSDDRADLIYRISGENK